MTEVETDTPEAARAEADAIMEDREGPYWDTGHRRHDETVDKVSALMSKIHGEAPAYDEQGTADFHEQFEDALEPAESPADYDFGGVSLAEDETWDVELEGHARTWLHAAGISEAEGKVLAQRFQAIRGLDAEGREVMLRDAEKSLRASWGADFDANADIADAAVDAIGPGFRDFLMKWDLHNDVGVITALLRIGRLKGLG